MSKAREARVRLAFLAYPRCDGLMPAETDPAGGGLLVRLPEFLAAGLPTVATPIGARVGGRGSWFELAAHRSRLRCGSRGARLPPHEIRHSGAWAKRLRGS